MQFLLINYQLKKEFKWSGGNASNCGSVGAAAELLTTKNFTTVNLHASTSKSARYSYIDLIFFSHNSLIIIRTTTKFIIFTICFLLPQVKVKWVHIDLKYFSIKLYIKFKSFELSNKSSHSELSKRDMATKCSSIASKNIASSTTF